VNIFISWSPNQEPDLYGYRVYMGETSGLYNRSFTVIGQHLPYLPIFAPDTSVVVNIKDGQPTYCAITALDTALNEGAFSDELSVINKFIKVAG